jgi:hypothetical protein
MSPFRYWLTFLFLTAVGGCPNTNPLLDWEDQFEVAEQQYYLRHGRSRTSLSMFFVSTIGNLLFRGQN